MPIKNIITAIRQWTGKPKGEQLQVLVIDDWIPDPSIGAGAPRAAQLLRALIEAGTVVTHFSTSVSPGARATITRSMPNVKFWARYGPRRSALRRFLRRFHDSFDVILISRPHNLVAFHAAKSDNITIARTPRVIYDAEAIFSERSILQKEISLKPLSSLASRHLIDSELDLAKSVDVVLTVNEQNASQFRNTGHTDVRILRHAVFDHFDHRPHSERGTILFVGPTYSDDTPNTDSVIWFVDHVLPLMRIARGKPVSLTLVGRSNAPAIASIGRDSVKLRGPIQDLSDDYSQALVFVAPTRFSAGIPLKVYEAASYGVPCVITSLLAEQIGWNDGKEVLVADTPELFSKQCLRLMEDEALWTRLRVAAHERTLRECDWSLFATVVQGILPSPLDLPLNSRRPQHLSNA